MGIYQLKNNARRCGKLVRLVAVPDYWPALRRRVFPAREHETLFANRAYETILDVGANIGQFAVVAACRNPDARIYSFEPISGCFSRLQALRAAYPAIHALNFGLGSQAQEAEINLSGSLGSSSFLPITEAQNLTQKPTVARVV